MSTDYQKYSTQKPDGRHAEYAARKNMRIVRQPYTDEGRSGVVLDKRLALKELISDVLLGHADFETVLVYDVSRWGRFQDSDESATTSSSARRPASKSSIAPRSFPTTAA